MGYHRAVAGSARFCFACQCDGIDLACRHLVPPISYRRPAAGNNAFGVSTMVPPPRAGDQAEAGQTVRIATTKYSQGLPVLPHNTPEQSRYISSALDGGTERWESGQAQHSQPFAFSFPDVWCWEGEGEGKGVDCDILWNRSTTAAVNGCIFHPWLLLLPFSMCVRRQTPRLFRAPYPCDPHSNNSHGTVRVRSTGRTTC